MYIYYIQRLLYVCMFIIDYVYTYTCVHINKLYQHHHNPERIKYKFTFSKK